MKVPYRVGSYVNVKNNSKSFLRGSKKSGEKMKKTFMFLLAAACFVLASAADAAELSADKMTQASLLKIIQTKYKAEIDQKYIVIHDNDQKILVFIDTERQMIVFWVGFAAYPKRSLREMKNLANKFNCDKVMLRVSVNQNGSSYCDYFIIYKGGINDVNLLAAIKYVAELSIRWEQFVLDGGFDD